MEPPLTEEQISFHERNHYFGPRKFSSFWYSSSLAPHFRHIVVAAVLRNLLLGGRAPENRARSFVERLCDRSPGANSMARQVPALLVR